MAAPRVVTIHDLPKSEDTKPPTSSTTTASVSFSASDLRGHLKAVQMDKTYQASMRQLAAQSLWLEESISTDEAAIMDVLGLAFVAIFKNTQISNILERITQLINDGSGPTEVRSGLRSFIKRYNDMSSEISALLTPPAASSSSPSLTDAPEALTEEIMADYKVVDLAKNRTVNIKGSTKPVVHRHGSELEFKAGVKPFRGNFVVEDRSEGCIYNHEEGTESYIHHGAKIVYK